MCLTLTGCASLLMDPYDAVEEENYKKADAVLARPCPDPEQANDPSTKIYQQQGWPEIDCKTYHQQKADSYRNAARMLENSRPNTVIAVPAY